MALKRISSQSEVRNLGNLRLWIDDLEEIVAVMVEAAGSVTITVDDYSVDEVIEMAELKDPTVVTFVARTHDPQVTLELSPRTARLEMLEPNLTVRGMATEIQRIVLSKQNPFYKVTRPLFMAAVAVMAIGAIVLANGRFWYVNLTGGIILALGFLLLILNGGYQGRSLGSARIIARLKKDAPPWLDRNRDALVTNAVVSLVFLIIGIVIGRATGGN